MSAAVEAVTDRRWRFFKDCVKWHKHQGLAMTVEFIDRCLDADGDDMVSEDEWRRLQEYAAGEKVPVTDEWDGDTALH